MLSKEKQSNYGLEKVIEDEVKQRLAEEIDKYRHEEAIK